VDVVTDYAPGIEFAIVRVEAVGEADDEVPAAATEADAAAFLHGRRVLDADVSRGVVELRVALLRIDRTVVATRRQRVRVRGETGTVVAMSRICQGVTCPGAGDESAATECAYGRCVPPECAPDSIEVCRPGGTGPTAYGCTEDAECEVASLASCASYRCVEAVCVVARDNSLCSSMEYCDIEGGCTPLPGAATDGGVDAGDPDAAIEGAPTQCLADGGVVPDPAAPGGSLVCPDDKNIEGCACPTVGATASCWPGLRVNRNQGSCTDGSTTCLADGRWGACEGAILPDPGAVVGDPACRCFSGGMWTLDRISTCFYQLGGMAWTVSSVTGATPCPTLRRAPTLPTQPWSPSHLSVGCAGGFELCYRLKAGDITMPDAACDIGGSCVEVWVDGPGATPTVPDLPAWMGEDNACNQRFLAEGGFAEMSVHALSLACDELGTTTTPYVFSRTAYCRPGCTGPTIPGCEDCTIMTSGGL